MFQLQELFGEKKKVHWGFCINAAKIDGNKSSMF